LKKKNNFKRQGNGNRPVTVERMNRFTIKIKGGAPWRSRRGKEKKRDVYRIQPQRFDVSGDIFKSTRHMKFAHDQKGEPAKGVPTLTQKGRVTGSFCRWGTQNCSNEKGKKQRTGQGALGTKSTGDVKKPKTGQTEWRIPHHHETNMSQQQPYSYPKLKGRTSAAKTGGGVARTTSGRIFAVERCEKNYHWGGG